MYASFIQEKMNSQQQQPQGAMEYAVVDKNKKKKRKDDTQRDVSTYNYIHSQQIEHHHACMYIYNVAIMLLIGYVRTCNHACLCFVLTLQ